MIRYLFFIFLGFGIYLEGATQNPFTPGNFVVYRIGDGVTPLTSVATPVFLDEYTPAGQFVQSVAMPVTVNGTNKILTMPGNATDPTGAVTRSGDGRYLILTGYNASVGTPGILTSDATLLQRTVGLVDYNATINTTTALKDFSSGNLPVGAVSTDGVKIWCVGRGGGAGTGGVRLATVGDSTSTSLNNGIPSIFRSINYANGQLYISAASPNHVAKVGTGFPETGNQLIEPLPGLPTTSSITVHQFVLLDLDPAIPGPDVLYFSEYGTTDAGGIRKYALSSNGSWVLKGTVNGSSAIRAGYHGLAASLSDTTVTLFATRGGRDGRPYEIVKITDASGRNGILTGTPTVLDTSSITMKAFKGVALVPVAPVACVSPSPVASNITASHVQLDWPSIAGSAGYEYHLTTNSNPPANGISTTVRSVDTNGLLPATLYYFHVRTKCAFNFSSWTTISFTTVCPVPEPTITVSGLSATVKWDYINGISNYQYAVTSSATPPSSGTDTTGDTLSLNGLSGATTYYIHLRSDCGNGIFSTWRTTAFTTGCPAPVPSVLFNVTPATATITWYKVSGASYYEYAILNYASPPPVGSASISTDTVLYKTNLKGGNKYRFYIRTHCKNGSISDWTGLEFYPSGIAAFPNPARNGATIVVHGADISDGKVLLIDKLGRIVRKMSLTGNTIYLEMSVLPAGVYSLKYIDQKREYTTKIVKL